MRRGGVGGLQTTCEVAPLSDQAKRRFGMEISVRMGVHRGVVTDQQSDALITALNPALTAMSGPW
jgi:hypothetical protein